MHQELGISRAAEVNKVQNTPEFRCIEQMHGEFGTGCLTRRTGISVRRAKAPVISCAAKMNKLENAPKLPCTQSLHRESGAGNQRNAPEFPCIESLHRGSAAWLK